jgi:hypothetical protein
MSTDCRQGGRGSLHRLMAAVAAVAVVAVVAAAVERTGRMQYPTGGRLTRAAAGFVCFSFE